MQTAPATTRHTEEAVPDMRTIGSAAHAALLSVAFRVAAGAKDPAAAESARGVIRASCVQGGA